jgi:hypothetical protein
MNQVIPISFLISKDFPNLRSHQPLKLRWRRGESENLRFIAFTIALLSIALLPAATATTPQYQIYDIGVIDAGDDASQGFGVSHGSGAFDTHGCKSGIYLDS